MERILRAMREEEIQEIVNEDGAGWWVGQERVSGRCCLNLLRLALLKQEELDGKSGFRRYEPNSETFKVLDDPDYVPELVRVIGDHRK
jgi:hypothetical protein